MSQPILKTRTKTFNVDDFKNLLYGDCFHPNVQLRGRNTKPCACLFAFFATPSDQAERLFNLAFD